MPQRREWLEKGGQSYMVSCSGLLCYKPVLWVGWTLLPARGPCRGPIDAQAQVGLSMAILNNILYFV